MPQSMFVASCVFAWVAHDADKLCKSLKVDEYMSGVTSFYTDFLLVCCCCLCAGLLGGAGA